MKMDETTLNIAISILTQDIMLALRDKVRPITKNLFTEFNRGPRPRRDQKINLDLKMELSANVLYQIEERLKRFG